MLVLRFVCRCGHTFYGVHKPAGTRVHDASVQLQIAIHNVFAAIGPPMTVRQVYYQLTTVKAVEKTEAGYDRVQRTVTTMRRNGSIPYHWLADNSRTYFQDPTYRNLATALDQMHDFYRRDLWEAQNVHVELWLEKRSLVSILNPVCREFGVRLYPMGGFASISFAHEAALELREIEKPVHVYHLSDLDADGAYSSIALERELRLHGASFQFHRLALTPQQISEFSLHDATREQKRTSSRWPWWVDTYGANMPACELDAIDPRQFRELVRNAIVQHIDPWHWERLQLIEQEEKRTLAEIAQQAHEGHL